MPGPKPRLREHTQARDELLLASEYAHDPQAFVGLLHILDHELRLVTPVRGERSGEDSTSGSGSSSQLPGAEAQRYQLTHDFLVPSIRRWLTRKQRETRRGRAERGLAERADEWGMQKGTRHLPGGRNGPASCLGALIPWSPAQRNMMHTANRYYALRSGGWFLLVLLLGFVGLWIRRGIVEERHQAQASRIVESIANFHVSRLSQLQAEVQERPRAVPMLKDWIADPATRSDDRNHARIVLLPQDREQVQPLLEAMLAEERLEELLEIREALQPYGRELILTHGGASRTTGCIRLAPRAAALAAFDPGSTR